MMYIDSLCLFIRYQLPGKTYGTLQLRSALLGFCNLSPKPFRLLRCSRALSLRPLVLSDFLPGVSQMKAPYVAS